jgi:hypothetical protein
MPLIWSWVNGDALRTKLLGIQSNLDQVRVVSAPAVPDGGYFVDVDREASHEVEGVEEVEVVEGVEAVEVGLEKCTEV